jgi:hypothetical protein
MQPSEPAFLAVNSNSTVTLHKFLPQCCEFQTTLGNFFLESDCVQMDYMDTSAKENIKMDP